MAEVLGIADQYFIGTSDPIKLDDKKRFTIPKKIQVKETPEELLLFRGNIGRAAVLGLFTSIPHLKQENPESVHAILAFSRMVKLDRQGRAMLADREINHLAIPDDHHELVVIGRGLSAVIADSRVTDDLLKYYAGILRNEGGDYLSSEEQGATEQSTPPLRLLEANTWQLKNFYNA